VSTPPGGGEWKNKKLKRRVGRGKRMKPASCTERFVPVSQPIPLDDIKRSGKVGAGGFVFTVQ